MVDLVKATKIYPPDVAALEDFSLTVDKGEMVFLTGMSGAGKSTVLKLISGIEPPTKGLVEVAGKDLTKMKAKEIPAFRQQIGMAHQDFKLLPDRTVAQNIGMAMEVSYENFRAIRNRVNELLQMLKLEHKHDTQTEKLSRGEQQRVAIARAVANYPVLILADEPTGNLDPVTTELVMKLFKQYNDAGSTIIIATHDEHIFQNTTHRVLELANGRLIATRPTLQP
ncbi:MAG: cell division ATP-binding protein FtsE [Deltaproteobacteria bacterium RIFOXYD12_FULL_57_12]|nr:MAG: cell division ATP-binding protein FtsE [Deltaproteobacteria bacterium RIFOXYD12_FULL_57_12]